jgi:protein-glutamine gamma-glutamyltransferase
MSFNLLYRASMYAMLFSATLAMSIDATPDNRLAMLYPPAVALAGAMALLSVDRRTSQGLPRSLAVGLSWGVSLILVYVEWRLTDHLLLALAHLLVYLQIIKILMPKSVEDDWLLFLLGLMQVLVGTFMSQSDAVGAALLAWAVASLWVLGLFYLHREAITQRAVPGVAILPAPVEGVPYPGLLDLSFLFASLRVVAITVALGGVIFLAMPRRAAVGSSQRGGTTAKHLTGFGDEIVLGQLGEILEDDSVVMSIELFDSEENRVQPTSELLWRGITMGRYEKRRWQRMRSRSTGFSSEPTRWVSSKQVLRQRIKLEPTDTNVLFGLRPILDATSKGRTLELNPVDGSIFRSTVRAGPFDYEVYSATEASMVQPLEEFPSEGRLDVMLQVPESIKDQLRAIAEPIVAAIPRDDIAARAKLLEGYLRDSGKFAYTLKMDVDDPLLDPVVDFLVNRKQGHCQYFASALTLLLRSIEIPARTVNGFKGGDWNDLAGVLTVRQKHAHSWVEVLVGQQYRRTQGLLPVWLTLDPTPGQQREEAVQSVGGMSPSIRLFSDFIRYVWVFYIAGFDAERQDRLVYRPIRQLIAQSKSGFAIMRHIFDRGLAHLLHFPDVASLISIRGFVVSILGLGLLVVAYRVFRWVWRRLVRWFSGAEQDTSALAAGVAFYRRLAQLLAEFGLERPPTETPHEFARRSSGFLAGRRPASEPVADVPPQVVAAFYRVRFGNQSLTPETLRHLDSRLDALEASLRG